MNFCDRMFKFPYRIYEDIKLPPVLEDMQVSSIVNKKWVVGYKRIYIEDIISISDTFYLDTDIDDIIENGFNASLIVTQDVVYSCEWDLQTLEKKLNEHVRKMDEDGIKVK